MVRTIRLPLPTLLLLGAALALLVPAPGPAHAASRTAFAEMRVLAGQAEVKRKSQTFMLQQGQRMTLRHSDLILTFADSKVHLRMVESSAEAIITANTRIRAGELTRDGKPRDLVTLLYGGLRMRVKRWLGKDKPVEAGIATIGIKGTDFVTFVKPKRTGEYISGDGDDGSDADAGADGAQGGEDTAAVRGLSTTGMVKVSEFIGIEGTIEAVNRQRPEYRLTIGHRQWGQMLPDEPPAPPIRVPDETWFATLETFSF